MKLSNYIDPKLIVVNMTATTKEEAFTALIDHAAHLDAEFARQKPAIQTAIFEREQSISTAMGNGVAMPHARVEGYDNVIVVAGVLKHSIECELASKERGNVRLIFLIVVGKTKNKLMLQLMAGITKLTENRQLFDAICREASPEKIAALIKDAKITFKATITAEDIMNTAIEPARLNNTLEEIARRLVAEDIMGLPVVDDSGKFLGEITERELIQYGMPKYTTMMGDLSFMTVGEPFEEYFKHESRVTVQELYRKNPMTIDKNASIMEISFIIVNKGNTRLYVVENGRYLGMVMRKDLIRKVLHI
ncbi:nitrogen regulatory IIA protein [Candidatus Moduliflexus flocculans]|uniref:Nitrogen regulatory IIA protein n=1 Tax=Candidatus Moduliflexus flocculans TaxID=1499966 RepID=A0A0S6VVJ8_9BACT|nr:nitrogen regulatory IIA protein [Candidatus Moduliflexus flocculans]